MARKFFRKWKWSEPKIRRMLKQGKGSGKGSSYIPFLSVRSLSSKGVSSRIWSPKTDRVHHLLSNNELHCFYAAEYAQEVCDIREQFPLPRATTQVVAERLGLRHPFYPGTEVPCVMTIDLLLTIQAPGRAPYLGIEVKSDESAEDPRSMEKLEITRQALAEMGWDHRIIFHKQIPFHLTRNIAWIRAAAIAELHAEPERQVGADTLIYMAKWIRSRNSSSSPLHVECARYDQRFGCEAGTGLHLARLLMHQRILLPDLNQPKLVDAPLQTFRLEEQPANILSPRAA